MLQYPMKFRREITPSKSERIKNRGSVGFNIKQVLEILFFDVLRGIFWENSFNGPVNRG